MAIASTNPTGPATGLMKACVRVLNMWDPLPIGRSLAATLVHSKTAGKLRHN